MNGEVSGACLSGCRARLVVEDQPSEGGEPFEEATEARIRPLQIQMRDKAGNDDQVRPAVSDNLVGDAHVASPDIPRLRVLHEQSLGLAATGCFSPCAIGRPATIASGQGLP